MHPLSRQELNRALWVTALESGKYGQCFGKDYDKENGDCCAVEVLMVVLNTRGRAKTIEHASEATGIHQNALRGVIQLNDEFRWTFPQIAAWVRREFPSRAYSALEAV